MANIVADGVSLSGWTGTTFHVQLVAPAPRKNERVTSYINYFKSLYLSANPITPPPAPQRK
jgi:hypothetical protein